MVTHQTTGKVDWVSYVPVYRRPGAFAWTPIQSGPFGNFPDKEEALEYLKKFWRLRNKKNEYGLMKSVMIEEVEIYEEQ